MPNEPQSFARSSQQTTNAPPAHGGRRAESLLPATDEAHDDELTDIGMANEDGDQNMTTRAERTNHPLTCSWSLGSPATWPR